MSKGYIEAFNNLKQELYYSPNQIPDIDKWHEIIEEALFRLDAIDNASLSEALQCLESLGPYFSRSIETYIPEIDTVINETQYLSNTHKFSIIKQALLKEQDLEKENAKYKRLFNIIKELVNINDILEYDSYEDYINDQCYGDHNLTREKFNLLKEFFRNDQ